MKDYIKKRLSEILSIPSFRLPKPTNLSQEELIKLKGVNWQDLSIEDLGGNGNIAHLGVVFPFETNATQGIIVDIQVLHNEIYQLHMHLSEQLQGLGLGVKITKAVINDFGHLYSGKGRILNPNAQKMWDKIRQDNAFECMGNANGELCMVKNNPDRKKLAAFMS